MTRTLASGLVFALASALWLPAVLGEPLLLVGGCEDVVGRTVCEREGDQPLLIWVSTSVPRPHAFTLDAQPLEADDAIPTDDGVRYVFSELPATGDFSLNAGEALDFFVVLTPLPADPQWRSASKAFSERRYEDAMPIINGFLGASDCCIRPLALRMAARVALRSGEHAKAQALLNAAIDAAQASGREMTAMHSAAALQFSKLNNSEDLAAARAALERAPPNPQSPALHRYLWNYHYAQVERTAGNIRAQRRHLAAAVKVARRMGWTARELRADVSLAIIDMEMGRPEVAKKRLDSWASDLPADISDYERAVFANNRNWSALQIPKENSALSIAESDLQEAVVLSEQHARPINQINAHLNLAYYHLLHAKPDAALDSIGAARALARNPRLDLAHWAIDLEARALAQKNETDRALDLYASLASAADAGELPNTAWRARTQRANVMATSNKIDQAIAQHREAELALDGSLLRVSLSSGRESMVAYRRHAMREHLDLLVEANRNEEALSLVMREQRRTLNLAHVRARIDAISAEKRSAWDDLVADYRKSSSILAQANMNGWMLSTTEKADLDSRSRRESSRLRELLDRSLQLLNEEPYTLQDEEVQNKDEVIVAIWRGRKDWIGLVRKADVVRTHRSTCAPDATKAAAQCVLSEIEPLLSDKQNLRLLLDSELTALDWHALRFRDGVLLDTGRINYGSGLAMNRGAVPAPGLALLVADPSGNLSAARQEIDDVAHRLSQRPAWTRQVLRGDNAVSTRVLSHLEQAALFHYAGHADFGESSGWSARLRMAGGTELNVGDILTLRTVPDVVVLSGCETALNAGVSTPTMGLANAFLASGASTVIATSRSVDDRSARAVMSGFYKQWLEGYAIDDALRHAQLNVRRTDPDLDWAAFRAMTP